MNLSTHNLTISADSNIDLHLHTIYSDGHWTAEQLIDHLVQNQFSLAAITDHDRVDKLTSIQQLALKNHMPLFVGVEMSTMWRNEMLDLLCFGFDPDHNALDALAKDLLHRQQENSLDVYAKLQQQGYSLSANELSMILDQTSPLQQFAFATTLQAHGYGVGKPSIGKILMEAGCAFASCDPTAVVQAAHQSGAVCLIAHPGRCDGFVNFDAPLLDQFRQEIPIDGLEVYYPMHSPQQTEMYLEYAHHNHLLISAGSDSHRPEKPPIKYPAEYCHDLLERLGIQIK
jgi:predicted metal-dependent phosphoesterase TrpH